MNCAIFGWVILLLAATTAPARDTKESKTMLLYIGTYTGQQSEGIYVSRFDPATGALSEPKLAAKAKMPSFVAAHPNGRFLYSTSETNDFEGKKTGAISAYAIDRETGKLTLLNTRPARGMGTCFVAVDATGRNVLLANYGSGSVAVLPIDSKTGELGEASAAVQHDGSSADPKRQEGPHAHSFNLDPSNRFALAVDLGLDQVLVYRFDADRGTLEANDPPLVSVAPGAGPRHLAFHPSRRWVYVINEMANTVTAFSWDENRGRLSELQTITSLPSGFANTSYTAEVRVHPSGRFLYGSNRGHDSIAIFAIDQSTGTLTARGHTSTNGKFPRHFTIAPGGQYLLAANQDSHNIVVFVLDPDTGALSPTGATINVGSPTCVKLVE